MPAERAPFDLGRLILNEVPGASPYVDLRSRALELELDGVRLAFASREDLIAMRRATARPQNLADIEALTGEGPA